MCAGACASAHFVYVSGSLGAQPLTPHACPCRVDAFVQCSDPGNYTLRTGAGPMDNDPECQSTHCQLRRQAVLATFVVVGDHLIFAVLG